MTLLAGAILIGVAPAKADVSVTVYPSLVELEGRQGSTAEFQITVDNSGDEAFEIVTGVAQLQDMTGLRSAEEWVSVSPTRTRIEPGRVAALDIEVEVPASTHSSGRYALITISTVPAKGGANVVSMSGAINVPMLLVVNGGGRLSRQPSIERFAPVLEPDGRLGVRAEVSNAGNVHARMSGTALLSGPDGLQASLEIPAGRVLPGAVRSFASRGSLPLASGVRYEMTGSFQPFETDAGFSDLVHQSTFVATPRVAIQDLAVCENLSTGPSLSASLVNAGDLGVVSNPRLEILDENDVLVMGHAPASPPISWPHETLDLGVVFPQRLVSGSYTLVASATYGLDSSMEASLPFSIGGDPATAAPLCTPLASELDSTD